MTTAIVPSQAAIETAILVDGGFTFDPRSGEFLRPGTGELTGYAIAIPNTESNDIRELVNAIGNADEYVGGWYDPDALAVTMELSELWNVTRQQALLIARARNQKAILDFATGEEITVSPVTV